MSKIVLKYETGTYGTSGFAGKVEQFVTSDRKFIVQDNHGVIFDSSNSGGGGVITGTFSITGDTVDVMLPTLDFDGYTTILIEGVVAATDIANDLAYGNQFYGVWKVSSGELTLVSTVDEYIKTDFDDVVIQFDTNGTLMDFSIQGQAGSILNGICKLTITKI